MKNLDGIYEMYYKDIYNPDMKIMFLEENYPSNTDTKKTILNNFKKSAIIERQLDKDLSIFSIKDINEVAEVLGYASQNTIQGAISYFASYTDWCISKGLRGVNENGVNDFTIFLSTQDLSKFVSKLKAENRYVTKEEAYDLTDRLVNYVDKAIVLALYEGIGGEKLHELRSLRREIVHDNQFSNNNILTLTDINGNKRVKNISNKLKYILKYAAEQEEYISSNGDTAGRVLEQQLIDTPYIVRTIEGTNNRNFNDMVGYPTLTQKIIKLKKFTGYDFITAKSLEDSGAINRVLGLTEEAGLKEPNDNIFAQLKNISEYNYSDMQVYNLKQKFYLVTGMKKFK